ncbi:MAG: hypothetical protein AAF548_17110 [Actinomycetota bacterium]
MASAESVGDELVEIELSRDLFESQMIAETVVAAGYDVRLLAMSADGLAPRSARPHRLLVRSGDLDAVRAVVAPTFPLD